MAVALSKNILAIVELLVGAEHSLILHLLRQLPAANLVALVPLALGKAHPPHIAHLEHAVVRPQLLVRQQLVLHVQEHHRHYVEGLQPLLRSHLRILTVRVVEVHVHEEAVGVELLPVVAGLLHEVVLVLDDAHYLLF